MNYLCKKRTEGSLFFDILQRKYLPLATKLITSHPSATGLLHEGYCITQHIEILGFRKMDIEIYVTNELSSHILISYCAKKWVIKLLLIKTPPPQSGHKEYNYLL